MSRRPGIVLAESAVADLEAIRDYFDQQVAPDAGRKIICDLLEAIEKLPLFPDRGRIVPEFDHPNLRELIHPPYRIVYWRDREKLKVVRVWRSERILRLP